MRIIYLSNSDDANIKQHLVSSNDENLVKVISEFLATLEDYSPELDKYLTMLYETRLTDMPSLYYLNKLGQFDGYSSIIDYLKKLANREKYLGYNFETFLIVNNPSEKRPIGLFNIFYGSDKQKIVDLQLFLFDKPNMKDAATWIADIKTLILHKLVEARYSISFGADIDNSAAINVYDKLIKKLDENEDISVSTSFTDDGYKFYNLEYIKQSSHVLPIKTATVSDLYYNSCLSLKLKKEIENDLHHLRLRINK